MFSYIDENGIEVLVIRETCHCLNKRNHIFLLRVKRFCFCVRNINWVTALILIACLTILFGIVKFLIIFFIALNGQPSAIKILYLFPVFTVMNILELITFVGLGILLLIGIKTGTLELVKFFTWGLLLGYLFAIFLIITLLMQGELLVKAIVWNNYGMTLKNRPEEEEHHLLIERIIFYSTLLITGILVILFTTYIIILTLSYIDVLESDIREAQV